jgi:hypothetical protein
MISDDLWIGAVAGVVGGLAVALAVDSICYNVAKVWRRVFRGQKGGDTVR